jgi:hypothetical protein
MEVVSFTLRLLYPQGKSPWYPLDRRLGGPQSRSGRGGEEKIPSPRQESNPRTPIVHKRQGISGQAELLFASQGHCFMQLITFWSPLSSFFQYVSY